MSRQVLVLAGLVLLFAFSSTVSAQEGQQPADPQPVAKKQIYTCPMHPEIQWSRPDKCPICDMKLVAKRAKAPSAAQKMHDHAGMSMRDDAVQHDHSGMGSMTMGCGCSMCMEMMGMGGMNGHAPKAVAPASRAGRPTYRSYPSRGYSQGCGC